MQMQISSTIRSFFSLLVYHSIFQCDIIKVISHGYPTSIKNLKSVLTEARIKIYFMNKQFQGHNAQKTNVCARSNVRNCSTFFAEDSLSSPLTLFQ